MASPSSTSSSLSLSANPRRTPVTRLGSPSSGHGLSLKTNIMLRKGATFHSPTSPSSDLDAIFCPPQLPRSQSNLDDVLDAYRRRAALTLDSIGEALANTRISSPKSKSDSNNVVFFDNDSDSVPKGLLDHTIVPVEQRRALQPRPVNRRSANHHHASDSGLGSSIASSSGKKAAKNNKTAAAPVQAKALTRSAATAASGSEKHVGLSARATNRIYEHTVKPLLAKPAYKAFHPILLECTTKINKKDIVCLRDLEKTILYLAPERTKAAKLYLDFCLESVRCLQTTVEYLSEREQTRPADLPYTAGYFIDLVEQIHHYAQQLADARDKKSDSPNMDFNSSDEIKLHGGITVNGRPAELVRISRDGRAVSIATGLPVELEEDAKDSIRIKRSASQELEDEEEIMRSMARRKKNAPPEEYAPKMCSVAGCTKEFKRPCDLTKHEKTHSRPWKCPHDSCKYHEYGWPTEKERDRHMNDKHSDNPAMYECLFKPCTYKSKRDSNRKQHMEKTHGWKYVRTKTNGASKTTILNKDGKPSSVTASTPRASIDASTMATPQLVNLPTPVSAQSPAVATPSLDEFSAPLFNSTLGDLEFPTCAPGDILATDMSLPTEISDMDFSPMPLDFADASTYDASAYASPSTVASSLDNTSAYQDIGPEMTNMFEDIYAAPMQLPTPEHIFGGNANMGDMNGMSMDSNVLNAQKDMLHQLLSLQPELCSVITPEQQQQITRMHQQMQEQRRQLDLEQYMPHISPLGEGNTMLYTPDSMLDDEGFVDYAEGAADLDLGKNNASTDFILFPPAVDMSSLASAPVTTAMSSASSSAAAPLGYKSDLVYDKMYEDMTPSLAAGFSQPTSQVYMGW